MFNAFRLAIKLIPGINLNVNVSEQIIALKKLDSAYIIKVFD